MQLRHHPCLVIPDGVFEVLLVLPQLQQRLHVTLVARLQHVLHLQVHNRLPRAIFRSGRGRLLLRVRRRRPPD